MISNTAQTSLWDIYEVIGGGTAGIHMSKEQLLRLVSDLRSTATLIEHDLKSKEDD